jgi:hypothetical protein
MRRCFVLCFCMALAVNGASALSVSAFAPKLSGAGLSSAAAISVAQPNVLADVRQQRWILTWQTRDAKSCSSLQAAILPDSTNTASRITAKLIAKGCDWFVNWADFPSLTIAENGDWLSFYLRKSAADSYAYDVWLTRSLDQGNSWQAPFRAHRDGQSVEHGFVSLAAIGGDRILAVWLDGRKSLSDDQAGHPHSTDHDHDDQMSLRSAEVSRAGVIHAEAQIDARVCSCCSTDIARLANEHLLVFRDRSADEIRDIGIARYRDQHWQAAGKAHDDQWRIAGCPVNGPAIAASGDDALIIWPTMLQSGALSVRARKLSGAATQFLTIAEGAAVQARVDVAAWGKDAWLVSWLGTNQKQQPALMVAIVDRELRIKSTTEVALVDPSRNIGIPKLASMMINNKPKALLVWTEVVANQSIAERPRTILRGSWIAP